MKKFALILMSLLFFACYSDGINTEKEPEMISCRVWKGEESSCYNNISKDMCSAAGGKQTRTCEQETTNSEK
jgi:hypothetical protein